MVIRSTFWRPSSIPRDFGEPAIGPPTGWCWGTLPAVVTMLPASASPNRSKKYLVILSLPCSGNGWLRSSLAASASFSFQSIDVNEEELRLLIEQTRQGPLDEQGRSKLQALLSTFLFITRLLENQEITLRQLRQLLLKPGSERLEKVLDPAGVHPPRNKDRGAAAATGTRGDPSRDGPVPGHGRNGAQAYVGAKKIHVPLTSLKPGDRCPKCEKGKLYVAPPGVLVRIVGQAPLGATVYELEKLRCNLCLEIFTAEAGEQAGDEKYDATAASMIALLKYGRGLPFYRLEGLQGNLGIPLPASTQWDIVA